MNKTRKIADILNDPLIGLVNKADGIAERSFAQLIESAARVFAARERTTSIPYKRLEGSAAQVKSEQATQPCLTGEIAA